LNDVEKSEPMHRVPIREAKMEVKRIGQPSSQITVRRASLNGDIDAAAMVFSPEERTASPVPEGWAAASSDPGDCDGEERRPCLEAEGNDPARNIATPLADSEETISSRSTTKSLLDG